MKIRTGFVSNSSSSSFVVLFPKKPESVEELKQMMFPDKKWSHHLDSIYCGHDITYSITDVVESVWDKILGWEGITINNLYNVLNIEHLQKYISEKDIKKFKELRVLDGDVSYNIPDFTEKQSNYLSGEFGRKICKIATKKFLENHKDKWLFICTYGSDNGGDVEFESFMENGDIFINVEHIYINQH